MTGLCSHSQKMSILEKKAQLKRFCFLKLFSKDVFATQFVFKYLELDSIV